jgi:hypothetical protein
MDWELVILAYHHRELAVPANPWMNVIYIQYVALK